jgi:hypothetical protein
VVATSPLPRGCSAPVEHDAADADDVLLAHSLADDRKGLLAHLAVGPEVIGRVEEGLVDLAARHEGFDIDRVRALDGDGVDLVLFDQNVFVLGDLVALDLIGGVDLLVGVGIDEAAPQAVAGLAVQEIEGDALLAGRRRVKLDGAGDEGELEKPLPVRAWRHCKNSIRIGPHESWLDSNESRGESFHAMGIYS